MQKFSNMFFALIIVSLSLILLHPVPAYSVTKIAVGRGLTECLQVEKKEVTFESEGSKLKGDLYIPKCFEEGTRFVGVIVGGPWTTVKEQVAGLYAERLAERGLVTLAFDHRFFGESEGLPRNYESPARKIEDFKNAISYLQGLSLVEKGHIGAVGIRESAGYLASVAVQDARLGSFASVAGWFQDAETVRRLYGGEEAVQERIKAGVAARKKYEQTGAVDYVPAVSAKDKNAAMFGDFDYFTNPKRGAVPQWKNRFAVMSWPECLQFDSLRTAQDIKVRTLLVYSEKADLSGETFKFFMAVRSTAFIYWRNGGHFDFYDREPQVTDIVDHLVHHFNKSFYD